jgi:hypothetical protein
MREGNMDSTVDAQMTPRTEADFEHDIEVMLERMKVLNARRAEDKEAIQQLRAETAASRARAKRLVQESREALGRLETLLCR